MGCAIRFIGEKILIPVLISIVVELVLDKYRRPKAQIHFGDEWKEKNKKAQEILLEAEENEV